jgi:hypothetical protein
VPQLGYDRVQSGIGGIVGSPGAAGVPGPDGALKFSGGHLGLAVGATTSYLADAGAVAVVPILSALQKYALPARTVANLRVKAVTNPLGAAMVVTVLKNGVATALTATITAGSTALFKNIVNTVAFAADDELDLEVTSTSAGAAIALLVATVELAP